MGDNTAVDKVEPGTNTDNSSCVRAGMHRDKRSCDNCCVVGEIIVIGNKSLYIFFDRAEAVKVKCWTKNTIQRKTNVKVTK